MTKITPRKLLPNGQVVARSYRKSIELSGSWRLEIDSHNVIEIKWDRYELSKPGAALGEFIREKAPTASADVANESFAAPFQYIGRFFLNENPVTPTGESFDITGFDENGNDDGLIFEEFSGAAGLNVTFVADRLRQLEPSVDAVFRGLFIKSNTWKERLNTAIGKVPVHFRDWWNSDTSEQPFGYRLGSVLDAFVRTTREMLGLLERQSPRAQLGVGFDSVDLGQARSDHAIDLDRAEVRCSHNISLDV